MSKKLPVLYNCESCPAYCCSYPSIGVSDFDLRRLAAHFGVSAEVAERRYTKIDAEGERVLRHRLDEHFGTTCRFLDPESRACRVYAARPGICRRHPGTGRCGYYDFLCAERHLQQDPDFVATTNNR